MLTSAASQRLFNTIDATNSTNSANGQITQQELRDYIGEVKESNPSSDILPELNSILQDFDQFSGTNNQLSLSEFRIALQTVPQSGGFSSAVPGVSTGGEPPDPEQANAMLDFMKNAWANANVSNPFFD